MNCRFLAFEGERMKSNYTTLMQSKYFNPAFNSAIFDGPIRIYFAQFHESFALKIYFLAQQKLEQQMQKAKELSKISSANIFIMVYPTEETFHLSFESDADITKNIMCEAHNDDYVIGLKGPVEDHELDYLFEKISEQIQLWKQRHLNPHENTAVL